MRVAVIGSRSLTHVEIGPFLPPGTTEIISGGAKGVDTCAAKYAWDHGIPLTEFRPDYPRYGRTAPLVRDRQMVYFADFVVALWDGSSHGTIYTVQYARKQHKPTKLYRYRQCE